MIHRPARLIGSLVAIGLVVALLSHAIDPSALQQYAPDLVYYTKRHLLLVGYSMALALVVGIPAGIVLSRPNMVGRAERFMQIFNIGNTVPPLAVLAIALGISRHRQRSGDLRAVPRLVAADRAQHLRRHENVRAPSKKPRAASA